MGHAVIANLSMFFVRRLYAKGRLTLKEACEQAAASGEKLQAGEGDYEEPEALGIAFHEIINYLTLED